MLEDRKKIFREKLMLILKEDKRVWTEKNEIDQPQLMKLIEKYDEKIIKILYQDDEIREGFFIKVNEIFIFKYNDFKFYIEEHRPLNNSYTEFKNRIGLTDGKRFIKDSSDIVLNFPFKECILEGGQSSDEGMESYYNYSETDMKEENLNKVPELIGKKEKITLDRKGNHIYNIQGFEEKSSKRKEIFFNEILAKDEIDRLLDKKALINWKRYNSNGCENVGEIKKDKNGVIKENLIIKGNNLLALHSLKSKFAGKVKLIYIDPPYNTGNDSFAYNDNFNHSTWLTFMKNRLEVAKELLAENGSIYINIDQDESHYLKVLLDEIFGRDFFKNEIIWSYTGGTDRKKGFNKKHDNIFLYTKSHDFLFNNIYVEFAEATLKRFNKIDENGKRYKENTLVDGRVTRTYMKEEGKKATDVWEFPIVNRTYSEYWELSGQKPEKLLERIITASSNLGDIVLDYHLGTGTTCAVAHKLGRQYIGIEQMEYIEDKAVDRLSKIINGEQGGISKDVNWQGGGDFIYMELAKNNEKAKEKIIECETDFELLEFFDELYEKYFLNYNLKIREFKERITVDQRFIELNLEDKKKIFMSMLDLNQMYVNASDIEDEKYQISKEDIKFTKEFYSEGSDL